MRTNFENLEYLVGNNQTIDDMLLARPFAPFADCVVDFLNALSKILMKKGKNFSDIVTFGFWCRKSAILKQKERYDDLSSRIGRGIVFHSTPSNVPVNFAFSFASGLLAGNANIVRLPAKNFEQVEIICECVNNLLKSDFSNLAKYVCMLKYSSDEKITNFMSSICDTRIIWGGDQTIANIRKSPLGPRATEITFADRHSIAVMCADEYLKMNNKDNIAINFYNDTYFSDQNACTSPRIIVWVGDEKEKAKEVFWENIEKMVVKEYEMAPVQVVGKLTALFKVGAARKVKLIPQKSQYITRVKADKMSSDLMDYKYNSGFFFEYDANDLSEILPICDKKCQTLTYLGIDPNNIKAFISEYRPDGVDRAVPMGKSMDFDLVWDGYDLIRELSRKFAVI